jgi:hypothetical protein
VLCQLSYSHRHCDYSNCDSELSEFTLALRKDREGLPVAGRAVGEYLYGAGVSHAAASVIADSFAPVKPLKLRRSYISSFIQRPRLRCSSKWSASQMQQISLGSVTYKSFLERSRGYVLLTLNLAGAVDYECLASRSWAIPQERGLHSETGEPFVWAFSVMPVFTIFFVVDVFWGALILVSQQWRRGYLWLLTALIWLVAAVIDFAHH